MGDDEGGNRGTNWREWLPVLSAAALLIGAAWFQGGLATQQSETIRRVGALETKIEAIQQIDIRTTRIEAKLDMLSRDDDRRRGDGQRPDAQNGGAAQ